MKNIILGIKCLEFFFVKSELASDRLSFLPKMGLEFFSDGLEFFWKRTKKACIRHTTVLHLLSLNCLKKPVWKFSHQGKSCIFAQFINGKKIGALFRYNNVDVEVSFLCRKMKLTVIFTERMTPINWCNFTGAWAQNQGGPTKF